MATAAPQRAAPRTGQEAAAALASGRRTRPLGGATKLCWGAPELEPELELSTAGLRRIREHNAGDLTAVLEAGVPLRAAQEAFASADQMLALDPPLGEGERATIGGVVATADSGPLRHRFGAARDLVVGITVALSDGSLARAGGKVIKNVAGYDLAKLFAGSFGTLGLIVELAVRLHPRPARTATAIAASDDPRTLAAAASALAHAPIELQALDVRWERGSGRVLARCGGGSAETQAAGAVRVLAERAAIDGELLADDRPAWDAQRAGQRSADGTVVKISGLPGRLPAVLSAAERLDARVVGRAALGLSWVTLPQREPAAAAAAVAELRAALAPAPCVVLDAAPETRARVEGWGVPESPVTDLMRRLKQRFDPAGICNPGAFVGGI